MTKKNIVAGAILIVALFFSSNGYALTSSAIYLPTRDSATPVKLSTGVNNLVFTGVVKKIPDGTALVTHTSTYLLAGGNFESIVGKEVNIIGKVIQEGSIEIIQVARAQLAHE